MYPCFRELLLTLDTITSGLHSQGIGAIKRSALVISFEHENKFWEKQLFGYHSPKALQRAVFYYVGLNFALRGQQEQHDLQTQQLTRHPDNTAIYSEDVFYLYTEFISKNNQHRFKDTNATNKSVRVYAKPGSERCVIRLLDFYISKLPQHFPAFYCRALDKPPNDTCRTWYCKSRIGINTLKNIMPKLSEEAGLDVHYTNHSLRATAVTRMYANGVPEKIIAGKSGHRSLKALRAYEHTTYSQEKAAGLCIHSGEDYQHSERRQSAPAGDHPLMDSAAQRAMPERPINRGSEAFQQSIAKFSKISQCTFNFYNS